MVFFSEIVPMFGQRGKSQLLMKDVLLHLLVVPLKVKVISITPPYTEGTCQIYNGTLYNFY